MKAIVFDSSSLISIAENCLMKILESLAENYKGDFYITEGVEMESVKRPLKIKRFELNALRIRDALQDEWIKVNRERNEISPLASQILETTNNSFFVDGKPLNLIQLGEAESLALCRHLKADALAIDERTTRMLLESPQTLRKRVSQRYQKNVVVDGKRIRELKRLVGGISIVRSAELIALAFEKKLFGKELLPSKESIKAALFALKFAGCGISSGEIDSYLKGIR